MAEINNESPIVEKALHISQALHSGQFKYDRRIPYISHILAVTRLVSLTVNNPEVIAAACLHDAIEKGGMSQEGIKSLFGGKVSGLVGSMTEPLEGSWKAKKTSMLNHLSKTKNNDLLLISCADKADNLYNLLLLKAAGVKNWDKKSGSNLEDLRWFHHSVLEVFRTKLVFRKKAASTILFSYENWYRELFN